MTPRRHQSGKEATAIGSVRGPRTAAAMVEIAVCLPVILLTVAGMISITSLIYLKQSLKIACYEACRVGTVPQAEVENVRQQVVEILDGRGVKNYTVTVDPSSLSSLTAGNFLTVSVSVETAGNVPLAGTIAPKIITESVSMMSEQ